MAFAIQKITFDAERTMALLFFTSGNEAKSNNAAKPKLDKKKEASSHIQNIEMRTP